MSEATHEVASALEGLRDSAGLLSPEAIVDAARDPASPLHAHFEWDDARAGHHYRVSQARTLIRSVKLALRIGTANVTTVAYVPSPISHGSYRRMDEVLPRGDEARSIMLAELSRVSGALGRARKIATVLQLENEIDDLLGALESARHRVEVAAPAPATT